MESFTMLMQTVFIFIVVVAVVPSSDAMKMSVCPISGRPCPGMCARIYRPVCATIMTEFPNPCFLNAAQCMLNKAEVVLSDLKDTSCPSLPDSRRREVNPLSALMDKAVAKRMGGMESGCPPNACTRQPDPVCGYYTKTFRNDCTMNSTICDLECGLQQGFYVVSQTDGPCP